MQGLPVSLPPMSVPPQPPLYVYPAAGGVGGLRSGAGAGVLETMGGGGEEANMMVGMPLYYAPPPPPTHFPPPPSAGAATSPRIEGRKWAQSLLLHRVRHQQRQQQEQQQYEHDAVSASDG
jgi:hypothetical protein